MLLSNGVLIIFKFDLKTTKYVEHDNMSDSGVIAYFWINSQSNDYGFVVTYFYDDSKFI